MSGAVFRVEGIPDGTTLKDLQEQLLNKEKTTAKIEWSTICPSCTRMGAQTALIQFVDNKFPSYLGNIPHGGYITSIKAPDGHVDVTIDKDFYGLTQLYPVKDATRVRADIVAVTGLNGHAYGSWRPKVGTHRMWLQDLFCDDPELENYRTMIYGYNTKLSEDGSQTIGSYTDDLLGDLKRMRNLRPKDQERRPIIFIGHSFGGIIIAHSLVDAKFDDSCHTLLEDTCAIIFLGTPHRGLYVEDIVAMIGTSKKARAELVMSLEAGARGLEKELKRFRYIVANKPLPVLSFCEKLPTRKLVKRDGRWSRSGEPVYSATTNSLMIDLPWPWETPVAVDADHSTIAKVQSRDSLVYRRIEDFLKDHVIPYLAAT